jgi:hypothetical protein
MKRHISATILLCLSVLLKAGWCSAATFTWNGSVSSDWFNKTNWTPAGGAGINRYHQFYQRDNQLDEFSHD